LAVDDALNFEASPNSPRRRCSRRNEKLHLLLDSEQHHPSNLELRDC